MFYVALRLGLTSFGGPVAHLGYVREEYVARRGSLCDEQFAELVALSNLLPGPSSSQVGIAIGGRAPATRFSGAGDDDSRRRGIGAVAFGDSARALPLTLRFPVGRCGALAAGGCFAGLLVGLPILPDRGSSHLLSRASTFFHAGSLVFGGGHVVLPLLNDAVVGAGWVSQQAFLAGYGLTQAVPGPLFAFSAYLGAIAGPAPNGVAGAAIAIVAIFLPSFLLLVAILPLWSSVRERVAAQAAVAGIGAAVVGLLGAALWDPVLRTSVDGVGDVVFGIALFGLLRLLPQWAVVAIAAVSGAIVF